MDRLRAWEEALDTEVRRKDSRSQGYGRKGGRLCVRLSLPEESFATGVLEVTRRLEDKAARSRCQGWQRGVNGGMSH
jgi:hypothetical protein